MPRVIPASEIAPLAEAWRMAEGRVARGAIVRDCCGAWDRDESSVRRLFRQADPCPFGKATLPRANKAISDQELQTIGSYLHKNAYGDVSDTVSGTVDLLRLNGKIESDASLDTIRRGLRRLRIDPKSLEAPEPSLQRTTSQINQAHFVDFSPCRQWRLHDDGSIEVPSVPDKPDGAARKHIWRFALTDHFSGTYAIRYYNIAGENARDLVDFLWRVWSGEAHAEHSNWNFRGVPRLLIADRGPSTRAAITQNLCAKLGIKIELHKFKNAKASGSVESRHHHWERDFEARLWHQPARTIEDLNEKATQRMVELNLRKEHTRHGHPPLMFWNAESQTTMLRTVPDWPHFAALAHQNVIERTTSNYLTVSVNNVTIRLEGKVLPQEKVRLIAHPCLGDVWTATNAQGEALTAAIVEHNRGGYMVGHRTQEIGETSSAFPQTPAQLIAKVDPPKLTMLWRDPNLDPEAFATPRGRLEEPAIRDLPALPELQLSVYQVIELLAARLDGAVSPALNQAVRHALAGGSITTTAAEELITSLLAPRAVAN